MGQPQPLPELGDAERVAIAYAPSAARPRYHAVLALDGVLQRLAARAREPLLAQVKLAWWRERIAHPGGGEHPVQAMLSRVWNGETAPLTDLIGAWEQAVVSQGEVIAAARALAEARGRALAACAELPPATAEGAGLAWSALTLAAKSAAPAELFALARTTQLVRLPARLRPLAVLDGLARRAAARGTPLLLSDRASPIAAMRLGILGR